MGEPICKIARENGGTVPLECLFNCTRDCHKDIVHEPPRRERCNRCGSTDVRWRQQTGKWVLFSNKPGKVHVCDLDDSDFGVVPE